MKELAKADISLRESVEASWKTFDKPLNSLQTKNIIFIENSVWATIQILYDVGLTDSFENKMKFSRTSSSLIQDEAGKWK